MKSNRNYFKARALSGRPRDHTAESVHPPPFTACPPLTLPALACPFFTVGLTSLNLFAFYKRKLGSTVVLNCFYWLYLNEVDVSDSRPWRMLQSWWAAVVRDDAHANRADRWSFFFFWCFKFTVWRQEDNVVTLFVVIWTNKHKTKGHFQWCPLQLSRCSTQRSFVTHRLWYRDQVDGVFANVLTQQSFPKQKQFSLLNFGKTLWESRRMNICSNNK